MLTFHIDYEVAGKPNSQRVKARTAVGAIRLIQSKMKHIMKSAFRIVKVTIL